MFNWERFWLQVCTGVITGLFVTLFSLWRLRKEADVRKTRKMSIFAGLIVAIVTPLVNMCFQLAGH